MEWSALTICSTPPPGVAMLRRKAVSNGHSRKQFSMYDRTLQNQRLGEGRWSTINKPNRNTGVGGHIPGAGSQVSYSAD